ncbi:MAG: CBS domain-containing protein [Chloroflexi bacterium]|nr:CBS domain-containing protein [Chloroflexota bacterium]
MTKLVRDYMKIGVPTCARETTLDEVARIMTREGCDAIIVMDEYGACGVVSQTNLVRAFSRNYELMTAEDVMSEQIVGISPESSLTAAANMMEYENVHQLFIMHEHPGPSRPSAVITMRQLVRAMAGLEPEKPTEMMKKQKA